MIKTIDNVWYSGGTGTVGVVLCFDTVADKTMAYIGVANQEFEEMDISFIIAHGAKVDKKVAEAIFGYEIPDYKW